MLPHESVLMKGLGASSLPIPLAKLHRYSVLYKNWEGEWKVAVSDDIPAPCLIGSDLVKNVFVTTQSQDQILVQSEK